MYSVKANAEDAAAYVFGTLAAARAPRNLSADAQDAIREAGAARAYGTLTPPGLRNLLAMSPEEAANLPVATRRMLQNFSSGMFRSLAPDDRDALMLDMEEGMADLQNVLKPFYVLTDSQGNRIFSDAQIKELEVNMSLNLGQLSGMGFLLSVQRQQQAQNAGMFMSAFMSVKKKAADIMRTQKNNEKQVAGMAAAAELLDAQIIKLKAEDMSMLSKGDQLARSVAIENLEIFADQFSLAARAGRRELDNLIAQDAADAAKIVDELSQPENASSLDAAFLSGELDSLLGRIALYQRTAARGEAEVAGVAQPPADRAADYVEIEGKKLADRRNIKAAEDRLAMATTMIREASVIALDKARPLQDAAAVNAGQSKLLQQIIQLERTNSDLIIEDAYSNVSTDINIPIVSFGNTLDRMFKEGASNKEASFLSKVNPYTLDVLSTGVGSRLYADLDAAAARSIDAWFSVPGRADQLNKQFARFGQVFEDGPSFRDFMKDFIVKSDKKTKAALDATDPSQITNLQLAYYMASPNKLKVDASDLQMITSPMELETFRQAAVKMGRSNNDNVKALAGDLKREVDRAFENWANTTGSVDQYNQVVLARTVYRAEQLRFEGKSTLGGTVESVQSTKQLTGEESVGRDLSFVLTPFVNAITNPGQGSASTVATELEKIVNTLAPVSHSLIEQRLVRQIDGDGKYIPLTDEELAGIVQRTVDEDTFLEMKALLGNAVRNAFYEASDMSRVRYSLDAGLIPGVLPSDAPKRIEVPTAFDGDVRKYLNAMSDASVITVQTADGPVQRRLLDMDDLIMADRQIDFVVNSVPEFREAHKDLLTIAKNAQEDLSAAQAMVKEDAASMAKIEEALPKSFSGRGFINNVMGSDAPNESEYSCSNCKLQKPSGTCHRKGRQRPCSICS